MGNKLWGLYKLKGSIQIFLECYILLTVRHVFPNVLMCDNDSLSRLERQAEIESLRRSQQLDSQDMFYVSHDLKEFQSSNAPHAHVIFMTETGRDGVDGGGMAVDFVFRYECGCCVLRNHESGIQARLSHQQPGQTIVSLQEKIGPAFTDARQFTQSDGRLVGGKGQRLAVEIAPAKDVTVRKYKWIVGDRVELNFDNTMGEL
jgi:hypothetical protein